MKYVLLPFYLLLMFYHYYNFFFTIYYHILHLYCIIYYNLQFKSIYYPCARFELVSAGKSEQQSSSTVQ